MHPLLRVPYGAAARLAELVANATPATASSKLGKTFAARRRLISQYAMWGRMERDVSRPLLWVHAPSVGEGLMALPVLQRVRQEMPKVQLAFTFFSPSAAAFAEQLDVDFAAYLPFDAVKTTGRALAALRPTAIIFSKLDVWPIFTERAHQRGVHIGLISASMPATSRRHGLGALLTRDAYAALDWVGAASAEDATRLIAAGVRRECVRVTGDTRYDQAWTRAHAQRQNAALAGALRSDRLTLVAGSTWGADEQSLLPAWEALTRELPEARLILVPHEPNRDALERTESWARRAKLRYARLSAPDAAADVILIDRVGVLADLYAVADVAYVGGGFHQAGLHSVVEPAVLDVPIIVGPRHEASRDAQLMLEAGGAVVARDSAEMEATVRRLFTDWDERRQMARALSEVVSSQRGATVQSFQVIQEWMASYQRPHRK